MTAVTAGPRIDWAQALKDTALTALVAFGLFLPLIGLETVTNMRNELTLDTRWPLLFTFVAIAAGGRLAFAPDFVNGQDVRVIEP